MGAVLVSLPNKEVPNMESLRWHGPMLRPLRLPIHMACNETFLFPGTYLIDI